MRLTHFEHWRPTCLACRAAGRPPVQLELARTLREDGADVIEGVLLCPEPSCQREYPIIDGIPVLVADPAGYIRNQLADIRARDDLSPDIATLLGDCAGPDSAYEASRYHLSIYGHGHWGDADPDSPATTGDDLASVLGRGLELIGAPVGGAWLDIGCSVGRGTVELTRRTGDLALGVDLNFAMLRMARRIARTGRVTYALRRSGLVYDHRSYAVDIAGADRVDFWACDATGLALADDSFDGAVSLNLLDCVPSPLGHLIEMGRVLRPSAPAVLATPYDWSSATPLPGWIGGHSQRSPHGGSPPEALRHLLSDATTGELAPRLAIAAELDDVPWRVRTHERADMLYRAHVVLARAT